MEIVSSVSATAAADDRGHVYGHDYGQSHLQSHQSPLRRWVRSDDRRDLAGRVAAITQRLMAGEDEEEQGNPTRHDALSPPPPPPRRILPDNSVSHSRSPASFLSSTAADHVPPDLASDVPSFSSRSVGPDTEYASSVLEALHRERLARLDLDGVLQLPEWDRPQLELRCPFQILDCHQKLDNVEYWKTHVLSHFRGEYPAEADCFHCGKTCTRSALDPPTGAWDAMLAHIDVAHFQCSPRTMVLANITYKLMKWMYNRRLATEPQLRAVQSDTKHILVVGPPSDESDMPAAPTPPSSSSARSASCTTKGSDALEEDDNLEDNIYMVQASARRHRRAEMNRRS